jgi:hypothetical protein
LYSTTSREMVEEQCFNEIEMFDYKFEEEWCQNKIGLHTQCISHFMQLQLLYC